jgi:hypothetical protein
MEGAYRVPGPALGDAEDEGPPADAFSDEDEG